MLFTLPAKHYTRRGETMAEKNEDDFLGQVQAMADRLGLTDAEERGQYVHQHMTRAGYTMVPSYVKEDDDKGGDSRGFFKTPAKGNAGGKSKGSGWFPG
jgi:hypothetical protein